MPATVSLSVVITTFNNAATLERCLHSLQPAGNPIYDELLILDSGSTDKTLKIATSFAANITHQTFNNYSDQKQSAIDRAGNHWVLLLDADEYLSTELQNSLNHWCQHKPAADAYQLKRCEWIYWRWQHPGTKMVTVLRLFDRRLAKMNKVPVHAAIQSSGQTGQLKGLLLHTGEASITQKVAKINAYSSGQANWRSSRTGLRLRMLFYPWFAFWREYLLRRQFLNGWAGFIAARSAAFYAFIKYAKAYENQRNGRDQSE